MARGDCSRRRGCAAALAAAAALVAPAAAARPRQAFEAPARVAAAGAAAPAPERTIYVVRHCARSVFPDLQGRGVPQYDHYANYTQYGPLPDWGVPPSWCTTRGTHIVRGQGRQLAGDLKAQMGARKVKVVPDPKAQRDLDTAAALLEGAGIDASVTDMQPDAAVFDPQAAGICHYPTGQQYVDAINQNLRDTPRPEDANTLLAKMQAALGKGVAPPIPDVPNTVEEEGYWEGGYYLASEWAEAFLLQYGAGLEVGYGQVSVPEDIYDYMRLHTYYRAVNDRPKLIERGGQSNLLAHMLGDLTASADADYGVSMYVGHDTNVDGLNVLLGLQWDASPYPENATPPGGMLRLTLSEGKVRAAFLYTTFESTDGNMTEVPARFGGVSDTMDLDEFVDSARQTVDWRCVPDGVAEGYRPGAAMR